MVSHDGAYLQTCHESKFKEDKIYERGEGLLPSALRSEFMSKLPTWCEWTTTNRDQFATDLEADLQFYDFDDLTLTHESCVFPSHFGDPFEVEIIPPFFDEETHRVTQQKILHRTFEDILDNTNFRSMVFEYNKPELSWTSQERDAVLGGGGTPKNKVG